MTMKEVLDEMRDLASQSLKTLEAVYDFHTKGDLTWAFPTNVNDHIWILKDEIEERRHVLSQEYEKVMLEVEMEVNKQFSDISDNIQYSVGRNKEIENKIQLRYIDIYISNGEGFRISWRNDDNELESAILYDNGCWEEIEIWLEEDRTYSCVEYSKLNYDLYNLKNGVSKLVSHWRKAYDEYIKQNEEK